MANLNLKFLRGLQASLPTVGTDGYFYLTTDTHRLYTSIDGKVVPVNEGVTTVENLNALTSVTGANAGDFFYCTEENILCVFNGQTFVQINPDTGVTSVEVVGEGNAVTDASYDPATRKLTLTKGETFATAGAIAAINDEETGILAQAKSYVDGEDIFEIDMNTINALGGIAAGTNLNGLSTHDVLKKLLYPYVDASVGNATASPNGGTYEKGVTKTITSVSISITKKSEPITSVALYNGSTLIEEKTGDAVKNGGTINFTGLSVVVPTDGNQLTVKVTYPDANGNAKTVEKKTTALTFVYPYYIGTCAAGTAIDETLVESLNKKIEGKGNKSNSFTVSDGHMVFAYPKAHGVLNSILDPNNFETIGNYTRSEVSVTGLDGTAQTYYVYVSGATTVSGFAVNFKY